MKFNKWSVALAAAGVVSLGSVAMAEESPVTSKLSPTSLSGYVSTSAIWKFGTGNGPFDGRSYGPGKTDGFNLDVVKVSLSKDLSYTGQWEAGYKFDALFGPDAGFYKGNLSDGHDMAIQNAYVLMNAPAGVGSGLDIKMGVFDTLVGYEVFDYPSNPNYSRSYGYMLEPLQHTGVTMASQLTEWLRIEGGAANTFDGPLWARSSFHDGSESETEKTYLGLITLTAPESMGFLAKSQLYAGVVTGNGFGNDYRSTHWYGGANINTPVEGLRFAASFDYRDNGRDNDPFFDVEDLITASDFIWAADNAWSAAAYLIWQINPKFTLADRFEYVTSDTDAALGEDIEILANTVTLDYKLWENVITRAEFRWDGSLSDDIKPFGSLEDGGDSDAFTLALNVIYQF
jgi:hypothetical protein